MEIIVHISFSFRRIAWGLIIQYLLWMTKQCHDPDVGHSSILKEVRKFTKRFRTTIPDKENEKNGTIRIVKGSHYTDG